MTETLVTGEQTQVADTQQAAAPQDAQATEGQQTQAQSPDNSSQSETQASEGDKAPEGAPEKYEFAAPEGKQYDTAVIEAYSEVAKELNMSQGDAQKLLDKVAPVMLARQNEQLTAIRTEWESQAKSDKEFGGDKIDESLGTAKRALDAFGTPELKQLLNESGLGNNPEVIRFMYRAGKAISEDKFVGGKETANGSKSLADRLYSK